MPSCPVCKVDVSNCTKTRNADGQTVYIQPVTRYSDAGGNPQITGGLSHIVGGPRCMADLRKARDA